jgi:hypothetical protein
MYTPSLFSLNLDVNSYFRRYSGQRYVRVPDLNFPKVSGQKPRQHYILSEKFWQMDKFYLSVVHFIPIEQVHEKLKMKTNLQKLCFLVERNTQLKMFYPIFKKVGLDLPCAEWKNNKINVQVTSSETNYFIS